MLLLFMFRFICEFYELRCGKESMFVPFSVDSWTSSINSNIRWSSSYAFASLLQCSPRIKSDFRPTEKSVQTMDGTRSRQQPFVNPHVNTVTIKTDIPFKDTHNTLHKERLCNPYPCVHLTVLKSRLNFIFANMVIWSCLNLIFFTFCKRCLFLCRLR